MAKRPILAKKVARLRKALRRTPDTYINLIQFLIDRRHANTVGGAKALLIAGKVMVDSHVVGRKELPDGEFVPDPFIKARYRDRLIVVQD